MIHFAPRGQLGFSHLLLASAILTGISIDFKEKVMPQKKEVPITCKTNILNTPMHVKKN